MELVNLEKEEFIEFSKNFPNSMFFQSPNWINVKKDNGWTGEMIGLKENGEVKAATILLYKRVQFIRRNMVYAPRGFLLDYNNLELLSLFVSKVKEYLKSKKALFLKINPYVIYQEHDINGEVIEGTKNDKVIGKLKELGFKHQGFYITMDDKKDLEPRWLSVLNIKDKTSDELFKNMRSTTRWSIRNSEKNSLKIIECKKEDLKEFKALMQHTADRREFTDRPLSYYENMYDSLINDNLVKVLLVEINFKELLDKTKKEFNDLTSKIEKIKDNLKREGELKELESQIPSFEKRIKDLEDYKEEYGDSKIIAGGLYMLYGRQLVYLFGASYKDFMKYNSQYLLQWEMIKYAIENKYDTFNFYGIDGDFSKESKNFGLIDFKRGFGCDIIELIGEFDLVLNKPLYKLYRFLFKIYQSLKRVKAKIHK